MIEEKQLTPVPATDLTEQDMAKIAKFEEAGLPGLAAVTEESLYRAFEMYLSGSTYWQIQSGLGLSRSLVVYMSHQYGWYPAKREYLNEMQEKIKARVIDSKLVSQDFLLLLNQAWQKKIGSKLRKYLATGDETNTDINLKEVQQLLKTIEMINDLDGEGRGRNGKSPAVGLNLGDGVTIERDGDNKVTITPKDKTLGDMLKKFADSRRAEEYKPEKKTDISEETKEE